MVDGEPHTELSLFSSPEALPTPWSVARRLLDDAQLFWLSTVRPDGRPHVTPLLGVWLDGGLCFCTGGDERKAKNLAANPSCVLTTGQNNLDGVDIVLEGQAVAVSSGHELRAIADAYEKKYESRFESPEGTWAGLGDSIRTGGVLVYRVVPEVAFGFGKGGRFSQTRWSFGT